MAVAFRLDRPVEQPRIDPRRGGVGLFEPGDEPARQIDLMGIAPTL